MLRALELCTSSKDAHGHENSHAGDDFVPQVSESGKGAAARAHNGSLTPGLAGQRRHVVPANGHSLASELSPQEAKAKAGIVGMFDSGTLCPSSSEPADPNAHEQQRVMRPSYDVMSMLPASSRGSIKKEPLQLQMVVEDAVWPEYTIHEEGTWAIHRRFLDPSSAKPSMRVTIVKTETRGPKSAQFIVYIMHVRTAFTVRSVCRRYSHFKMLDADLRKSFLKVPALPGKRLLGVLAPTFIAERRRQLQEYLDEVLASPEMATSYATLEFLDSLDRPNEEQVVSLFGQDPAPPLWNMPPGAPTDAVEQVLSSFRQRGDRRQEARALLCLSLMHAESHAYERAIPALQEAVSICQEQVQAAEERGEKSAEERDRKSVV